MIKLLNDQPLNQKLDELRALIQETPLTLKRDWQRGIFDVPEGYYHEGYRDHVSYPLNSVQIEKNFIVSDSFIHRQLWFSMMPADPKELNAPMKERFEQKLLGVLKSEEQLKQFTLSMLTSRMANVQDYFETALGFLSEGLQLKKDISQRMALHQLQQYYIDLSQNTEVCLQPFDGLFLRKRAAHVYLGAWMEFVAAQIRGFEPSSDGPSLTELDLGGVVLPELELPEEYRITMKKLSEELALNVKETALLFFFLRKTGSIQHFSNNQLAKMIHLLTGYNEQNLRVALNNGYWVRDGNSERERMYLMHLESYFERLLKEVRSVKKPE